MTGALYGLGGFCARRWPVVIGLWLVLAIGLVIAAQSLGSRASDNLTLPGTGSQKVTDLLSDGFPDQANGSNPIVLRATSGKVTDAKYADAINESVDALEKDEFVAKVVSPLEQDGAAQVSKDGTIAYISVFTNRALGDITVDEAQSIVDNTAPAAKAGLDTATGGPLGSKLSKPGTESSEVVGLTMALVVLAFTFGTFVAMGLPIATALIGVIIGLSGITLLTHLVEVPTSAATLALMLGLGVGIDYALFIVTTHRETLARGMEPAESTARAVATSGGAVLFAGCTVVIAVLSLGVAGIPILTTLGVTTGLMVALAMVVALTLLPAVLGLLGAKINALPLPGRKPGKPLDVSRSRWARFAEWIIRHPLVSVVIALTILVPLCIPAFSLKFGQPDTGQLPTDLTARQAYDDLTTGFGVGANGPIVLATSSTKATSASDPALTTLRADVQKTSGVASVSPVVVDAKGTIGTFTAIPTTAPSDFATQDLVNTLRDTTIPQATKGSDVSAYVGGSTAGYIDLGTEISDTLPETIAVIIGLAFVLLMIAFRSVLIPLKAAACNLLSIGAAYGVVVMVFQYGWFSSLVGLEGEVPIVSFLPLLMFAGLFGLSMDYEVFLMSHVQAHHQAGESNRTSLVRGLAESARVITAAALIMVSVFASFILNGDPTIKQFGVGLSVAVIIDATVVRCLLVPAVMWLLQNAAWWMPRWLHRIIPRISIEGHGYFADRDAGRTTPPAPDSA